MAVRDYMTPNPGKRGRAARKIWVQISQKLDPMQHNSGQKFVFTKDRDSNNVSIAK